MSGGVTTVDSGTLVSGRVSGIDRCSWTLPLHIFVQRRIELLDNPELIRQLRSLEEQKTDRGQVDIRPSGRTKDDLAVAAALAASQLVRRPSPLPPMRLGIVECDIQALLRMSPGSCPYEAICANFPRCMDEGSCQGFVDGRVIR